MYFNKFDICEAWFLYAMLWHKGQCSKEYKIFGRLRNMEFKPSDCLMQPYDLSENGLDIYSDLVKNQEKVRDV